MADVLQDAVDWLAEVRASHLAQQVTYRRGNQQVTLVATFGAKLLKVNDGHGGVKLTRSDRDFIVTHSALNFGAGPTLPVNGDLIDVTTPAGEELRFEVAPPGPKEPAWQWADPYSVTLRCHSKFIGVL